MLCYGWGEENGEKFWHLQNTWGKDWGEGGMFRFRRGVDDSAIESLAEAATPYSVSKADRKNSQFIQTPTESESPHYSSYGAPSYTPRTTFLTKDYFSSYRSSTSTSE